MNRMAEADSSTALIRDSVGAIAPRGGDLERIRQLRFNAPGFAPDVFARMAELGWMGLRVPEERGGAGLGLAALCAVAEELGAGLVPEPFIACATIAPLLPDDELASVLGGESLVVPAWEEQAQGIDLTGTVSASNGNVSGRKRFVVAADRADAYLVATTFGLALVPRDQPGVDVTMIGTQDGGFVGDVAFAHASARMIGGALDDAFDDGALATAAYLFGTTERMFDMALEYLKTRRQFGQPIGAFQALQHRAADLKIQLELTRATIGEAIRTADSTPDRNAKSSAISRAKARASDVAMLVAREATQFHGAIGITDELDLTLYTRKALALYNAFGSSAAHRARYAALNFD